MSYFGFKKNLKSKESNSANGKADKVKAYVLALVVGFALAAGGTYAWNAVWHGTDWIESGAVIDGQKIAENFEYLKQQINSSSQGGTSMVPIETGRLLSNTDVNMGQNWQWIDLEGTGRGGDAAAVGGSVARLSDGSIKATFTGWTGGIANFIVNSSWQCSGTYGSSRSTCAKLASNGDLILWTGGSNVLGYTKFALVNSSALSERATLKEGWPDVIECTALNGVTTPGTVYMYLAMVDGGVVRYANLTNEGAVSQIAFNESDGSFAWGYQTYWNGSKGCENKSIQQLKQEGKTYRAFIPW